MISSRSFKSSSRAFSSLQIFLAVPNQLLGGWVIRGQGQPAFCVFIGGGCGAVCHQAGIAHPGVPVRVVLSLGADGLQQINGVSDEILVHFTVGPMHSMISQNRQIAVSPTQLDGQQIAPLLFRDSFDGLDALGNTRPCYSTVRVAPAALFLLSDSSFHRLFRVIPCLLKCPLPRQVLTTQVKIWPQCLHLIM